MGFRHLLLGSMLAVSAMLVGAAPASALTYTADEAQVDAFAKSSGGHAFHLQTNNSGSTIPGPGGHVRYLWHDSEEPLFNELLNGVDGTNVGSNGLIGGAATLTGRIYGEDYTNSIWDVDIQFINGLDYDGLLADGGLPKLELANGAYLSNGGTVDPTTWHFYDLGSAVLTYAGPDGTDFGDGTIWSVGDTILLEQRPANRRYRYQIGEGANGKNIGLGLSGWLSYGQGHSGDINIDLDAPMFITPAETAAAPEPVTASLGLLGLGGLMVATRRRRRRTA